MTVSPTYTVAVTHPSWRWYNFDYFIEQLLCLDTTMPLKLQYTNKRQDKKILRLKLCGKIKNARLKLEPNVLIKKSCGIFIYVWNEGYFLLAFEILVILGSAPIETRKNWMISKTMKAQQWPLGRCIWQPWRNCIMVNISIYEATRGC